MILGVKPELCPADLFGMRALSIRQPSAEMILRGEETIECGRPQPVWFRSF